MQWAERRPLILRPHIFMKEMNKSDTTREKLFTFQVFCILKCHAGLEYCLYWMSGLRSYAMHRLFFCYVGCYPIWLFGEASFILLVIYSYKNYAAAAACIIIIWLDV